MSNIFKKAQKMVGGAIAVWFEALVSLVPKRMRRYFLFAEPSIALRLETESSVDTAFSQLHQGSSVDVELGAGLILSRQFRIPLEAENEVEKVVRLEVERIMPLPLNQLIYSFTANVTDSGSDVIVSAARKTLSDAIISACDRHGLALNSVTPMNTRENNSVPFNYSFLTRRHALRVTMILTLLLVVAFIFSAMPKLYASRLEAAIARIDDEVSQTRRQTESIAGLQRQMRVMQGLYQSVEQERQVSSALDLLKVLTDSSPDGVVFEDVRLDGNRLFVTGVAVAPESWVLDLERAPAFSNVSLSSVVGMDDNLSKRFEIRFNLVSRPERVAP